MADKLIVDKAAKEVFTSDLALQKPTLESLHKHVVYLRDGIRMIEAQLVYFHARLDALEKEILAMRGIHV